MVFLDFRNWRTAFFETSVIEFIHAVNFVSVLIAFIQ